MTRSFFIFTMAISVIHNPSDNKLRGLIQMFACRFLQRRAFLLCGAVDLSSLFGSPFFRLPQQLPAVFGRGSTRLL